MNSWAGDHSSVQRIEVVDSSELRVANFFIFLICLSSLTFALYIHAHTCKTCKTCKTCSKQYTGETTDQFRLIWNNYKSNDRKFKRGEPCMQEHLYEHFYSDGHNSFLEDGAITLIDKTDGRDPKNRENYWMRFLKTLALDVLTIEDCVWPNTLYTTYHTIQIFLVIWSATH